MSPVRGKWGSDPMGDLAEGFSFDSYTNALLRAAAMDERGIHLMEMSLLGALGAGAVVLFVVMIVRRSGTAAAGFALLMLSALSQAIVFGTLDFITPETRILIASLTVSALLLFVNAVLHTGRENIVVAGFSALVILGLLGLAGANFVGMDFVTEARLAMLGATAVAAGLLVFAMVRDFRGKAFLSLSVLLAVLATLLMTDPVQPLMRDLLPITTPSVLLVCGILLATLMAPFLADEMRMTSGRDRMASAHGYAPTSLFGDEAASEPSGGAAPQSSIFGRQPEPVNRQARSLFDDDDVPAAQEFPAEQRFDDRSFPEDQNPFARQQEPEDGGFPTGVVAAAAGAGAIAAAVSHSGDPVSNYWRQDPHTVLEAAPDEYVWDALAQPEVRCGDDVLRVFQAHSPTDLGLEGLRDRLSPQSLVAFDGNVLGGADPQSGSFEVRLETAEVEFTMRGRRKVDHDGILMRVDAEISDLAPIRAPAPQLAAPVAASAPAPTQSAPDQAASPLPRNLAAVVKLTDRSLSGIDVVPDDRHDPESWKEAVLAAGGLLKSMLNDGARGAFALIDATSTDFRPGLFAGAVGKAFRTHELPRGAMVVGLGVPQKSDVRSFIAAADDIRKGGGGVALMIDGPNTKPIKGFEPDMIWVSAMDLPLDRRSRKPLLEPIARRFGAPVVVRDLGDDREAQGSADEGASFGVGRAFADVSITTEEPAPAPQQQPQHALQSSPSIGEPQEDPNQQRLDHPGGAMSALRARGLR